MISVIRLRWDSDIACSRDLLIDYIAFPEPEICRIVLLLQTYRLQPQALLKAYSQTRVISETSF